MDSFYAVFETLENRLGGFWARALVLLFIIGAFAWAMNSFIVNMVLPITQFVMPMLWGSSLGIPDVDARTLLTRSAVSVALLASGWLVLRFELARSAHSGAQLKRDAETLLEEVKRIASSVPVTLDEEVAVRNSWLRKKRTELEGLARELMTLAVQLQATLQSSEERVTARFEEHAVLMGELRKLSEDIQRRLPLLERPTVKKRAKQAPSAKAVSNDDTSERE